MPSVGSALPPAKTADLHLHTLYSDGTDTPERVVELAKEAGLSAIALTDHDNTDAFAVAEPQARRVQRVHEMVQRLSEVGVRISADEVLELAGMGTVGRPHVARILLKRG